MSRTSIVIEVTLEQAYARSPPPVLEAHTQCTATVEGAGDSDGLAVKDRAGSKMTSDFSWTFTTEA